MIYDAKNYTGTPERRCEGDTVRCARRGGDSPRRGARTAQRRYSDPRGTNEERIAYLQSLGWEVEPTPILEQEITMPKDFPDVLKQYNELQRQQGFDLEEYAGKKLTLYTYRITNHPDAEEADASLYVYRSELVGGDVHSTSFTGFMTALR